MHNDLRNPTVPLVLLYLGGIEHPKILFEYASSSFNIPNVEKKT